MKSHIAGSVYSSKTNAIRSMRQTDIRDLLAIYQMCVALGLNEKFGFGKQKIKKAFYAIDDTMATFGKYSCLTGVSRSKGIVDISTGWEKLIQIAESRNLDYNSWLNYPYTAQIAKKMEGKDIFDLIQTYRLCVAIGLNDAFGFGDKRLMDLFAAIDREMVLFDENTIASEEQKERGYTDMDAGKIYLFNKASARQLDAAEAIGITLCDYGKD